MSFHPRGIYFAPFKQRTFTATPLPNLDRPSRNNIRFGVPKTENRRAKINYEPGIFRACISIAPQIAVAERPEIDPRFFKREFPIFHPFLPRLFRRLESSGKRQMRRLSLLGEFCQGRDRK